MSIIDFMLIIFICFFLYRYLRGSIAFYILIGLLSVYFTSFLLEKFGFKFLSDIINHATQYSIILIAIIFQPELRTLLLTIGNNRISKRFKRMKNNFFDTTHSEKQKSNKIEIIQSLEYFSKNKIGATMVIFEGGDNRTIIDTGVTLNAEISSKLIESIFNKQSPLHDGAITLQDGKIKSASCILPISEKTNYTHRIELRHKSAIGVTEISNCLAIIVSETNGKISYAKEGKLYYDKNMPVIAKQISTIFNA